MIPSYVAMGQVSIHKMRVHDRERNGRYPQSRRRLIVVGQGATRVSARSSSARRSVRRGWSISSRADPSDDCLIGTAAVEEDPGRDRGLDCGRGFAQKNQRGVMGDESSSEVGGIPRQRRPPPAAAGRGRRRWRRSRCPARGQQGQTGSARQASSPCRLPSARRARKARMRRVTGWQGNTTADPAWVRASRSCTPWSKTFVVLLKARCKTP